MPKNLCQLGLIKLSVAETARLSRLAQQAAARLISRARLAFDPHGGGSSLNARTIRAECIFPARMAPRKKRRSIHRPTGGS